MDNRAIDFRVPSTLFDDRDDGSFRGVEGAVDDDEAGNLHEVRW